MQKIRIMHHNVQSHSKKTEFIEAALQCDLRQIDVFLLYRTLGVL